MGGVGKKTVCIGVARRTSDIPEESTSYSGFGGKPFLRSAKDCLTFKKKKKSRPRRSSFTAVESGTVTINRRKGERESLGTATDAGERATLGQRQPKEYSWMERSAGSADFTRNPLLPITDMYGVSSGNYERENGVSGRDVLGKGTLREIGKRWARSCGTISAPKKWDLSITKREKIRSRFVKKKGRIAAGMPCLDWAPQLT